MISGLKGAWGEATEGAFRQFTQGKIEGMKNQQFGIVRPGQFNTFQQRKFGRRPEF